MESHLWKYEKVEPFDIEYWLNWKKEWRVEIQPKEKIVFTLEDEEESQEVIEKICEGVRSVAYKVYDKRNDRNFLQESPENWWRTSSIQKAAKFNERIRSTCQS